MGITIDGNKRETTMTALRVENAIAWMDLVINNLIELLTEESQQEFRALSVNQRVKFWSTLGRLRGVILALINARLGDQMLRPEHADDLNQDKEVNRLAQYDNRRAERVTRVYGLDVNSLAK